MTLAPDTTVFERVGHSVLDSLVEAMKCHNLDVPERVVLGFERPSEDACPELVGWISNIRLWDRDFPDSRDNSTLNRFFNGWAFDVTIRLGLCFIDFDDKGQPLDAKTLNDWSAQVYRYVNAVYFEWVHKWRAGEVSELSDCDYVDVGPCTSYKEGGCGGWEFRITVGLL